MKDINLWVVVLILAGILSTMLILPEGAPRFAVFGVAVAAAVVMYLISHRPSKQ